MPMYNVKKKNAPAGVRTPGFTWVCLTSKQFYWYLWSKIFIYCANWIKKEEQFETLMKKRIADLLLSLLLSFVLCFDGIELPGQQKQWGQQFPFTCSKYMLSTNHQQKSNRSSIINKTTAVAAPRTAASAEKKHCPMVPSICHFGRKQVTSKTYTCDVYQLKN